MASQVEICNLALSFLGVGTITNITGSTTSARVLNAEWDIIRDSELRKHTWRFAIKRASLPATTDVPVSGPYSTYYNLPSDCLKVLMAGDSYPGADMTDYRTIPSDADYVIEGNKILSSLPAPLSLRYVARISDTGAFDASFANAMAAQLAWKCCERITQSAEKRRLAMAEYDEAIKSALRSNVIEKPPEYAADSSWVLARVQ